MSDHRAIFIGTAAIRLPFDCLLVFDLEHSGQELVAYHWTPEVRSLERRYPHLHIGRAVSSESSVALGSFHKLHLPTNLISIQHLIRFAIQELGVPVRPGQSRDSVLAELNRAIGDS